MTLDLRGLVPAPVTPLTPDLEVDHDAVASLTRWLASIEGVKGLVCLGHAGEGTYLTAEEQVATCMSGSSCRRSAPRRPLAELFGTPVSEGTVATMTKRAADGLDDFLTLTRDRLAD